MGGQSKTAISQYELALGSLLDPLLSPSFALNLGPLKPFANWNVPWARVEPSLMPSPLAEPLSWALAVH